MSRTCPVTASVFPSPKNTPAGVFPDGAEKCMFSLMKYISDRALLNTLAQAVFFGGMLLWSSGGANAKSSWDTLLLNVISLLSGLGLCIVLVAALGRLKAEMPGKLPAKLMKNDAFKCG